MRRRAFVAAAVVAVGVAGWLVLRDPLDGLTQAEHRGRPAFTVLYDRELMRPVATRPGELLRLRARRGPLVTTTVVRRLRLPPYAGDVSGLLPVQADGVARALGRRHPGFRLTADTRARVHGAPGYEVSFTWTAPRGVGAGTDLLLVPPDAVRPRDGVVLSYRLTKPAGRQPLRRRRTAKAMRSALRSFQFGLERS